MTLRKRSKQCHDKYEVEVKDFDTEWESRTRNYVQRAKENWELNQYINKLRSLALNGSQQANLFMDSIQKLTDFSTLQSAHLCDLIGVIYEQGDGTEQDDSQAFEWYQKAAEKGFPPSQFNVGRMFYQGKGVSRNYEKAVYWLSKASENGETKAKVSLWHMYVNGQGVDVNVSEGMELLKEAAYMGDVDAQCNLGSCYLYGKFIKKDVKQAENWLRKAANQGDPKAKELLNHLEIKKSYLYRWQSKV
ncbi:hypothetical protein DNHGIG_18900 [Collibacillus ludicampi]|uniref:Sel1 repeat family protein n=1 Tax=Collibacillus ludicampi TaxID=2771369 RepID=A0AAV4LEU6_9BACL|nr:tetratricopeptide repeat protein [Collibacillus ludicampi]GIM46341.1 hypothetical protein DNHGIG_18900 [Collibacillus ludicampi]